MLPSSFFCVFFFFFHIRCPSHCLLLSFHFSFDLVLSCFNDFCFRFNLLVLVLDLFRFEFNLLVLVLGLLRPQQCPLRMSDSKGCVRPKKLCPTRCRTRFRRVFVSVTRWTRGKGC